VKPEVAIMLRPGIRDNGENATPGFRGLSERGVGAGWAGREQLWGSMSSINEGMSRKKFRPNRSRDLSLY
jgi:hypothetical protein